ncbi:MAG: DUF5683 domain-containing protein [Rikenellaceae bacterium]|jgi:hypothetical protein|nr:DUF5683 domain-containing protein [Rikenellaceae bacterium]
MAGCAKKLIPLTLCALVWFAVSAVRAQQPGELVSGGIRAKPAADTAVKPHPQSPIFRDSMGISKMTAISFVAPGFSQLYNRDYWKIPVLYAGVGTLGYLWQDAGKKYRDYKSQYEALMHAPDETHPRSEIDPVQEQMMKYQNQRNLYLIGTVGTYLYFIGNGALNYPHQVHPVKKATTLAMIFPGAGQIYNKSYWKVPIVIGAFASMAYIIDFNSRGYNRFRLAYNQWPDDEFGGRIDQARLQNARDMYRRNRDLSIIGTAGLYLLSIIDAHVDAYMRDFDVGDDLSMHIEPTLIDLPGLRTSNYYPGLGMSMQVNFNTSPNYGKHRAMNYTFNGQ